jgi:hypothetical protein
MEAGMKTGQPDYLNLRLWLMLAIVGALLCLIGWYRFLH